MKWQGMETAPRDRDFLVQLESGYITRARYVGANHLLPDDHPDHSNHWIGVCWQELPPPLKAKGARRSNDYTPEFLAFYAGFPCRKGESKFDAFKAWRALGPTQQAQAKNHSGKKQPHDHQNKTAHRCECGGRLFA